MADFYSTEQLCSATGRNERTIRRHVERGYISPEPIPGVRGFRFRGDKVRRWLSQRFPRIKPEALDAPPPAKAQWMQNQYGGNGQYGHLVRPDGSTPCGAIQTVWVPFTGTDRDKCNRCKGGEKKH